MSYELFCLEKLVQQNIKGIQDEDYLEVLWQESERICDSLKNAIVNKNSESAIHYLRQHQYGLIELIGETEAAAQDEHRISSGIRPNETIQVLCSLLNHFQKRYPDFFDYSALAPSSCSEPQINEIQMQWKHICIELEDDSFPQELIANLEEILEQSLNSKDKIKISFNELSYLKEFIGQVSYFLGRNQLRQNYLLQVW